MKLFCPYSSQFEGIFQQFFLPSLKQNSPEIEVVADVFRVEGNGNFRSPGFNQALIYKWKQGLQWLYQNPNQAILFTDVDIIFNKPLLPAIVPVLGDADLAVTPEMAGDVRKWGVNVGVLALRSSAPVLQFVSQILDRMILKGEWDQFVFNALLPQSGLKGRLLPTTFANGMIPYNENSILFHATCTEPKAGKSSLERKTEALLKAAQFFSAKRQEALSVGPG